MRDHLQVAFDIRCAEIGRHLKIQHLCAQGLIPKSLQVFCGQIFERSARAPPPVFLGFVQVIPKGLRRFAVVDMILKIVYDARPFPVEQCL